MMRLRHDARALHETFWREASREDFCGQVRSLEDRYGELIQLLPIATERAFEKVRAMRPAYFRYDEGQAAAVVPANNVKSAPYADSE